MESKNTNLSQEHNNKLDNSSNHENNPICIHEIKQTDHSVTIDWSLFNGANIYRIEKFHKRSGWEQVAWKSYGPADIENLDDSFAYKLRIVALRLNEEHDCYEEIATSDEIVARTLPPQPTTISLHRAIKKGQQFLVKRILRRRPSLIAYPGPNGYLPLANAIIYGENCVADVLLSSAGASVHIGNVNNARTPLHLAFFHGRLPVARILLNRNAQLDAVDMNGMTACHFAIDANQFEILKFGIENGANLEATDACGWTLLLRAAVMCTDISIIKLLIKHSADRMAVDKLRQNCMDLARIFCNEDALKYFEQLKIKNKYKNKN